MAGGTEFTSRNGTNGVHGNGGDAGYASDASNGRAPRLVTHGSDHDGIQLDDGDDHLAGADASHRASSRFLVRKILREF
ncbi:hypothetical protein T484DRAFT_1844330 [Baffinella frigidus]|nr:hypothetical protein T484DRAFT_1844330 [Cryptophyta sp. CCMP2293]